jgi:hypothetical protein
MFIYILLAALSLMLLKPVALAWFSLCYELYSSKNPLLHALFYPAAAVMIPLDISFNLTWGSYIFQERPHELTFSGRVRRHLRHDTPTIDHYLAAVQWGVELNSRWPGHIVEVA